MFTADPAKIITTLLAAQQVVIVSHRKPDGDTIGAALALAHYLEQNRIAYTCFCLDRPAPYFNFLPKADRIGPHSTVWQDPTVDVVVTVDAGDLTYAGIADHLTTLPSPYTLINIDHHVTNPGYGDINLVVSDASSTCEIIYHVLDSVRAVDRVIANCLLAGLITDTGSFSNLATTATAVAVAAKLLARGANLHQINTHALHHRPYTTLKLWGRALERLHEDPTTGMIVTVLTLDDITECAVDDEAVSGISNFLNGLEQAADKAVLVLTQSTPGTIKGSLRTTNPLLDVSTFAKLYGGGGHTKAAGFTIPGTLQLTSNGYTIVSPSH